MQQVEYIIEQAWKSILKFVKQTKRIYCKQEQNLKQFFKAVVWVLRTGAQWRALPEKYGKWNSVFVRFNGWSKKGIWKEFMEFCIQDPDLEYISIDTTIIRAHACAAGYGDQEKQGLGRSRGGFSTKIHAKVDALGNPIKFIVTPGQAADSVQASELLKGSCASHVLADKGYDNDQLRAQIRNQLGVPVIPGRSNRKEVIEYDKHIYKERHVVECFFSKIKHFRRVFSRFDKSLINFSSFLHLVGAFIWLR